MVSSAARQSRLAFWLLILATAVWGSTFIVVQDGINAMPMMMFMGWRFVIAFLVMLAIRPQALRMTAKTFRQGLFIGIALALGYWTQTFGLYTTSATVSGFITGMFVVITPILAGFIYKMKIPYTGWLGVVLATVGLALISLKGWSFGVGESWTLVGAAFFSFQIMWLSRWATPATSYSIAMTQVGTTAVIFFVGGLFIDGFEVPQGQTVWISILFLAVFASALAFIIQTWSQSHMNPTKAAIVLSAEPVFAGLFGVLVAGDVITLRIALGGLLILGAMYLVELGPRHTSEVADDLSKPHLGF
jgi:drug/metabolite transporter (DMT)-like permease